MNTREEQIQIGEATWTVRLTGEVMQIIDDQGRERCRIRGHMLTGQHFAMALAQMPFRCTPNLDEALRRRAAEIPTSSEGPCEFCGDPATHAEHFDREVLVCDACHAE